MEKRKKDYHLRSLPEAAAPCALSPHGSPSRLPAAVKPGRRKEGEGEEGMKGRLF